MRPHLVKRIAVILFVLLGSIAIAGQVSNAPKGSLEGVILNDVTGEPVAGVEVQLGVFVTRSSTPPAPGVTEVTPRAPNAPVLTTGPDGKFSFKDINAETYRVIAAANGFIRQEYGQKTPYGIGRPVYVTAGQTLKDVNIRLLPTGAVSGRILQDSGQPALGATVWILRPTYNSQGRRLQQVTLATADDRGDFRVYGIAPGSYYVAAGTDPTALRQFAAVGDPNVGRVQLYAMAYYPAAIDLEHASAIEVRPTMDARVDMRLSKRQEFHVRGQVVDAATNRPPERAQVSLLFQGFQGMTMQMPAPDNYSADTGKFNISGVAPGDYTLRVQIPLTRPADLRDANAIQQFLTAQSRQPMLLTAVTVSTADVEGLSLVMSPGVTVPGKLVVEGQPPIDLSKFAIRLGFVPYSQRFNGFTPDTPPVTPEGEFGFPNIQSGDYQFLLNTLPNGFYLKSVKYGGVDVLNKPIRVDSKAETVEVTVQAGTGALAGSVTDSRNNPVAGIPVAVVPDQRDLTDNYRIGITKQDGNFTIANVPPGRYKVFSWEASEQGAYFDRDFLSRYEQQGQSVTIQEGANSAPNVRLIPAS